MHMNFKVFKTQLAPFVLAFFVRCSSPDRNMTQQNNSLHPDSASGGSGLVVASYADVNGLRMYYEIHGKGEPLVLIHGGGSTINTSFGVLIPMLSGSRQVIAVELQSHGRTSNRPVPETFQQDADDVVALLKHLAIQKADILGFSNGGQTAMDLAIRHPGTVRKLILLSMFYKRSAAPPQFWEFMKTGTFANMPQIYKDEFLKVNNDPEALMAMYTNDAQRMQNFENWNADDVTKIAVPALIVMGDRDVAAVEHAVEMHRLIKNSRLLILPGTHGSYFGEAMSWGTKSETPEAFVALLQEFLNE